MPQANPASALVRVGDGRGFVVEAQNEHRRLVITAAHCLPEIPAAPGFRADWAETLHDLLGPLGGETAVWVECLFVDPIADVAVLGSPDNQELFAKAEAYDALLQSAIPLRLADVIPDTPTPARVITLAGPLAECTVRHLGGPLFIEAGAANIEPGMSGSPILDMTGAAVAIVSQSAISGTSETGAAGPRLVTSLPGWLLIELAAVETLAATRRSLRSWRRATLISL